MYYWLLKNAYSTILEMMPSKSSVQVYNKNGGKQNRQNINGLQIQLMKIAGKITKQMYW